VASSFEHLRDFDCIFCNLLADRVIASNALAFAIRDNHPATQLHTLVIPKRHAKGNLLG
jgi:ATP adenylyltransferase